MGNVRANGAWMVAAHTSLGMHGRRLRPIVYPRDVDVFSWLVHCRGIGPTLDLGVATIPLVEGHEANPMVPCCRDDDLVSRVGVEVAGEPASLRGDVRRQFEQADSVVRPGRAEPVASRQGQS